MTPGLTGLALHAAFIFLSPAQFGHFCLPLFLFVFHFLFPLLLRLPLLPVPLISPSSASSCWAVQRLLSD